MARKTVIQTVSLQPDTWNYLNRLNAVHTKRISALVNEALRLHERTTTSKELKKKMIEEKKRYHAKEIYKLEEELKDLENWG